MVDWTVEKIAALPTDKLKALRENATRLGADELVRLIDNELARRSPPRRSGSHRNTRTDLPVCGYHFVCSNEQGVIRNGDGSAWSGTWVVAESRVEDSLVAGAYVALHNSKSEMSYLQGKLKSWRKSKRARRYAEDREAQTAEGIDFLIQLSDEPLEWRGDGSGEKGYYYGPQSDADR